MNKGTLVILLLSLAVASCRDRRFQELDNIIRDSAFYEAEFKERTDSLRHCLDEAETDSLKWSYAKTLYGEYRHFNLDSCDRYLSLMMDLLPEGYPVSTSSALSNILVYQTRVDDARKTFESITLPEDIDGQELYDYCIAGEQLYTEFANEGDSLAVGRLREIADLFYTHDSTATRAVLLRAKVLRYEGRTKESLALLQGLSKEAAHDFDLSHYYYNLAEAYADEGQLVQAENFYIQAACQELSKSKKLYMSLYRLAILLFESGDIERACRYIQKTTQDAVDYNYLLGLRKSAATNLLIQDKLRQVEALRSRAISITLVIISLLAVAAISLFFITLNVSRKMQRLNKRYKKAATDLHNLSKIKDTMLGQYIESSSNYIYKVDSFKSQIRRALKLYGADEVKNILKAPSFADEEYPHFLSNFDRAFLGIFPDFVNRVNTLMKPEFRFVSDSGSLTTETRILALIRLNITDSAKIANILHISKTTVYTYRCRMRGNSLNGSDAFENEILSIY